MVDGILKILYTNFQQWSTLDKDISSMAKLYEYYICSLLHSSTKKQVNNYLVLSSLLVFC